LDAAFPGVADHVGLFTEIKSDWEANGRDWTRPGFQALAQHRFGVWRMGLGPFVLRAPFSVLYRMLHRRSRNRHGIELPYSVSLGRGVVIEHQSGIVVHGSACIGDGCIIRQGVTIGNKDLDDPLGAPVLGRNVNVGAGAKILGRVTIGDGASIGANAVVLNDVAAGQTVVGIPARVVVANKAGEPAP
jgi:serine O-acetyltransferase